MNKKELKELQEIMQEFQEKQEISMQQDLEEYEMQLKVEKAESDRSVQISLNSWVYGIALYLIGEWFRGEIVEPTGFAEILIILIHVATPIMLGLLIHRISMLKKLSHLDAVLLNIVGLVLLMGILFVEIWKASIFEKCNRLAYDINEVLFCAEPETIFSWNMLRSSDTGIFLILCFLLVGYFLIRCMFFIKNHKQFT